MKKFAFILFSLSFIYIFSQNNKSDKASYIFEGSLTNEKKFLLEEQIQQLEFVKSVKIYFKPEKQAGEVILDISREIRSSGETIYEFNPSEIKKILLDNHLTPLEFNWKE